MVNWNANDHPVGVYFYCIQAGIYILFKDFKSFRFLACDDLKARQLDFNGEKVNQACYYKLITSLDTVYYFQIDPATDELLLLKYP